MTQRYKSSEVLQAIPRDEERLPLAFQSTHTFAYEWNPATQVITVCGGNSAVLGIKSGSRMTEQQVLSKLHPRDLDILKTAFLQLTPQNPETQISHRLIHPERGSINVVTSGCAMFDESGKVLQVFGMVADVTPHNESEVELAITNDWLQVALEAGKSVGWDWDLRTGVTTWFGDLETMYGIPSKIHVGKIDDFRRRVHPEDQGLVWKAVHEAREGRKPYLAEFRVVNPDGNIRWVGTQGRFYYSVTGKPERMMGIAVDISERKRVEEALRRNHYELAEAERLAGVGSWQWDPESDTVTWSEELYRIVGRDPKLPAPSYGEHPQLYKPESWERLRNAVENSLWTGESYELELEMIRADGSTRWTIARGEAQRDGNGRVIRLRGSVHDITERRRSQQVLRENEERLRLAAQAGRMYAYEWDRASDVIVRSAEYAHILGLNNEPKETTCQHMLSSVHPDDQARVVSVTYGCTPENPTCRVRYRVIRPDRSIVWLEKNARGFFDAKGTMYRMIGMVADITERKLAEEALSNLTRRLIEAQETERARIARDLHDDIGQRLALLSVTVEQLKDSSTDTNKEARGRMDELRKQILDISRAVHTLSHELHCATLQYLGLVDATRGFCAELSEQQRVDIDFAHMDVPKNIPPDIALCFFRVVQEALHNAVKHSNVHEFEVELLGRSGTGMLELTVRDLGVGFDPPTIMTGRGLGLTSMQERLKLVEGELSIISEPGRGTTIRAIAPIPVTAPAASAAS